MIQFTKGLFKVELSGEYSDNGLHLKFFINDDGWWYEQFSIATNHIGDLVHLLGDVMNWLNTNCTHKYGDNYRIKR
jgi:hypothetical protein